MNRLIIANWKMNGSIKLVQDFHALKQRSGTTPIICPPTCYLPFFRAAPVALGAQNCHASAKGAFTGETSPAHLQELGCTYVIIGHSERRTLFHETDAIINAKARTAINHGLTPIICVGETLDERKEQRFKQVLLSQLDRSLHGLLPHQYVIAYEPIWSIGTGLIPTNKDTSDVITLIRNQVNNPVQIVYGGSVTDKNAHSLSQISDLNGVLVGGASLDVSVFQKIIDLFQH